MADTPASSAPSSSGSYSDVDMRDFAEWNVEIAKSFKVSELEQLLVAKGKSPKGLKPQKAMEVAWCYTREEIATWRRQRRQAAGPPALMVDRGSRQASMTEFFPIR